MQLGSVNKLNWIENLLKVLEFIYLFLRKKLIRVLKVTRFVKAFAILNFLKLDRLQRKRVAAWLKSCRKLMLLQFSSGFIHNSKSFIVVHVVQSAVGNADRVVVAPTERESSGESRFGNERKRPRLSRPTAGSSTSEVDSGKSEISKLYFKIMNSSVLTYGGLFHLLTWLSLVGLLATLL